MWFSLSMGLSSTLAILINFYHLVESQWKTDGFTNELSKKSVLQVKVDVMGRISEELCREKWKCKETFAYVAIYRSQRIIFETDIHHGFL